MTIQKGFLKIITLLFTYAFLSHSVTSEASFLDNTTNFFYGIGNETDLLARQPQYATVYVPSITWHNRLTYSRKDINRYNETPRGLGFGIEREDDRQWTSLYAMAFEDSFRKVEPIMGYGYERRYSLDKAHDWRAGLGYTIGVTARDNWEYAPIPVILPLASINYKRVSFQSTYIPGTYGNGNVFFAWLRFQFPLANN